MAVGGPQRGFTNHSDGNVFAATSWTPTLRHTWNPDNTLAQWQERFGEDQHSRIVAVTVDLRGTGFRIVNPEALPPAMPLPHDLEWSPPNGLRVGSQHRHWP